MKNNQYLWFARMEKAKNVKRIARNFKAGMERANKNATAATVTRKIG